MIRGRIQVSANKEMEHYIEIEGLIDTGATFVTLQPDLLDQIQGLPDPHGTMKMSTAHGTYVAHVYHLWVKVMTLAGWSDAHQVIVVSGTVKLIGLDILRAADVVIQTRTSTLSYGNSTE